MPTRHLIHRRPTLHGFTLIELLVVVTIIVVLLALLTPALDKAIYQAEMAKCASTIKALNGAVTLYAFNFRRHYPYRPRARDAAAAPRPEEIRTVPPAPGLNYDDRITVRDYIAPNKMMQCPLAKTVNIETDGPETQVLANYQWWWGWQYNVGGDPLLPSGAGRGAERAWPGMFKVGDSVGWSSKTSTYQFRVLAADIDFDNRSANGFIQSSHPDRLGLLANRPQEDNPQAPWVYTSSFWIGNAPGATIDRHFGMDDGSVRRFVGLQHNMLFGGSEVTAEDGQRVVKVPLRANNNGSENVGEYTYLPTR